MLSNRMLAFRPLSFAIGALAFAPLLFAPDAFAQDIQATPPADTTTSSASGKHFAIVGGVAVQQPTGNATIAGQDADFDGEAAPTLSASYYVNDNIAVEAWGAADKFGHRVRTSDGKVASVDAQPYAVSGQYHFRSGDSTVRPFVGLGYFESNISDEKAEPSGALAGQRIGMTTAKGPMATVGVDLNFSPTWFARADARYLKGGSDIAVDGTKVGEADLDPMVVGIGVGARF
jgi:outer membrane protein